MNCARHPKQETQLRCNRCETPICPRCAVVTPVGQKCPSCARPERTVSSLTPALAARCLILTMAAGFAGGLVVNEIPFLRIIAAIALGYAVGEVAWMASGRRAHPFVHTVAGISAALGLVAARAVARLAAGAPHADIVRLLGVNDIFFMAAVFFATLTAVSQARRR